MSRLAFTLVELLVVIAIIAVLSAFLLAAAGGAQQGAQIKATESLLTKADAGIDQFIKRFKAPPMPTWQGYDDGDPGTEPGNKLFWRLGSDMTVADREAAETAIAAARPVAMATATTADVEPYHEGFSAHPPWHTWGGSGTDYQEGCLEVYKLALADREAERIMRSHQRMAVLSVDDIGKQFIAEEALVDSWGTPLIYMSVFDAGVPMRPVGDAKPITGRSYDSWRVKKLIGFETSGRETIVDADADGSILDDAEGSDMRFTAYPGFEMGFELWSAGPDGKFNPERGHPDNHDNICVTNYRKELGE